MTKDKMYDPDYSDYPDLPEEEMKVQVEFPIAWNNDAIQKQATENLVALIYNDLKPVIAEAAQNKLDDVVNTAIASILEHPMQATDSFGKPKGPPESIKERLEHTAEEWLMERVDRYGHASGYNRDQTRAEYLFWETVKKRLDEIVKKVIVASIGDLEDVVTQEVKKQLVAMARK